MAYMEENDYMGIGDVGISSGPFKSVDYAG